MEYELEVGDAALMSLVYLDLSFYIRPREDFHGHTAG